MNEIDNAHRNFIDLGRAVVETELQAVKDLLPSIDANFAAACHAILTCHGRTVVTGMGKSGHIAGKIAATLASTGTPAFFMHPGEAGHGDLGMIISQDLVLALSNSGETDEILNLLPIIKRLGIPLIAITGNAQSTLAEEADIHLCAKAEKEACSLGLAPTASTTVALVMGDALAVALLDARGFSADDFALSHPSGKLGRRLLLRVGDIMHRDGRMPKVPAGALLREALVEMTRKGLGVTAVTDSAGRLLGVFTDGDVRRALDANVNFNSSSVSQAMTRACQTISAQALAVEALKIMDERKVNALPVVENGILVGIINMHDLLREKIL
ncbi:MAG: KpsF/GutQ family sugar-phosphate isomerase [Candidatus Eutrophobiaceae bacterium]